MADTETKKLVIDVSGAVSAIERLKQSTVGYNQTVNDLIRTMRENNNVTGESVVQLNKFSVEIQRNTRVVRDQTKALNDDVTAAIEHKNALTGTRLAVDKAALAMLAKNKALKEQKKATDEDTRSNQGFSNSLLLATLEIHVFHRALTLLTNSVREGVSDANEFQRRIAEIKTVSIETANGMLVSAKSTGAWSTELIGLSRNFGIPVLEQARGVYEALSNQVVNAGNATGFMASEMKLALTAVSSLDKAVDITSTVINAYHKNASDAERINAVLFRGVDLGRFRLDELGSSFGRVSLLASQLGVTFEEVVGSLALLTRLGVKADVANTLLANTFNSLIKPTKELTHWLQEQGFASGESAIKTLGFAKIFQLLSIEVEKGSGKLSELSKLFEDIRGLTGAAGLSGNFEQLAGTIKEVSNAQDIYNKAFELTMENLGVRGRKELEKFKQYFLVQFGIPLQGALVRFSESMGGADKALAILTTTVVAGTTAVIAYKVATTSMTLNLNLQAAAFALVAAALFEIVRQEVSATENMHLFLAAFDGEEIEKNRKILESFATAIQKTEIIFREKLQSMREEYGLFFASIRKVNFALEEGFKATFKALSKEIGTLLKAATKTAEKDLKSLLDEIKKSETKIATTRASLTKLTEERDERKFREGISALAPKDAILALTKERERLELKALAAVKAGETKLADDLFKRIDELSSEAEKRLKDLKEKADKIITSSRTRTTIGPGGVRRTVTTPAGSATFGVGTGTGAASRRTTPAGFRTPTLRAAFTARSSVSGPADAAESVRLAAEILKLEKARTAIVEARIKEEEAFLKKEEAALILKKKDAADREAALVDLKETFAEIDNFAKDGKSADLDTLIRKATSEGAAAGVDFLALRAALNKATELKKEIQKKELRDSLAAKVDAAEKEADATVKAEEEAHEKVKNLNAKRNEEALKFVKDGKVQAQEALKVIGGSTFNDNNRFGNEPGSIAKKQAIEDLKKLNDLFNQLRDDVGAGKDTAKTLGLIAEQQKKVNAAIQEFQKFRPSIIKDTAGGLTLGRKPDFVNGQLAAPGQAGDKPEALIAKFKKVAEQQVALAALRKEANKAANDELNRTFELEEQRLLLKKSQVVFEKETGEASMLSGDILINQYTAANRILQITLDLLLKIKAANGGGAAGGAAGGGQGIPGRAFGFIGTDQHLAALSDGESVMSRLATRQYAPFLRAMQSAAPSFRGDNTTMNFGDITINAPSGTSTAQAANIATQLIRLRRRGFRT